MQRSQDVTVSLSDIGVTKNESSRLQKIASIPDKIVNITNLQDATKNKISLSENLQDAYKQIETIEEQAKLTLEMLTGICFDEHTEITTQ